MVVIIPCCKEKLCMPKELFNILADMKLQELMERCKFIQSIANRSKEVDMCAVIGCLGLIKTLHTQYNNHICTNDTNNCSTEVSKVRPQSSWINMHRETCGWFTGYVQKYLHSNEIPQSNLPRCAACINPCLFNILIFFHP